MKRRESLIQPLALRSRLPIGATLHPLVQQHVKVFVLHAVCLDLGQVPALLGTLATL